ncbi:MAG: MutS2 family protein [Anaerolineales bacterium]|nr:MutS2 family protein [Anaerolineales bacterium]
MDAKSIHTLELPKILERLSKFTSFSAGAALALALAPTADLREARRWQQETSEARKLLAVKTDATIGGAHDVRPLAELAARGGVLQPGEMLDVKTTLIAARTLHRLLTRLADQFPRLAAIASGIEETPGLVEAISRTIDERGEVLDSASEHLAVIRRELRIAHDRLLQKLQRLISDPKHAAHLQEAIITQRDGRYVIPLKADFKGRIRGIVHDQSASGATLFIEPLATVELNNEWREKQLAEVEEIRRIMTALSALVGEQADKIIRAVEALADLDLAFAKAKYADAIRANEPLLKEFKLQTSNFKLQTPNSNLQSPAAVQASSLPSYGRPTSTTRTHPGSTLKLLSARHPLLNPEAVVPVDVELDDTTYALVITGPNTGGKTVSLKTVGLLALMAQCGLHIPAQSGSELSVFQKIYADICDEQSIEQSLSTFSAHVATIIRILKEADDKSLVLLDELGAGTDPAEGSALARAILSYLLDKGATTLVATHYPELKGYAHNTPGVKNASVEFDLETLAPTYHLTIGLPGRSNAFAIATRLGLDSTIVDEARTMVAQTDLEAEKLLDEIHRQRDVVRAARERAEESRSRADAHERELADERRKILEQSRAQAEKEIEALREELGELKRKLARAAQSLEVVQEVEAALEETEEKQSLPVAPLAPVRTASGRTRPIRLGDTVKLKTLNSIGVVTALAAADAEVQVGRLRVRAKLDELELRGSPEPEAENLKSQISNSKVELAPSPGLELDIRGRTVEEALPELERYLDAAYLAGLPWVRIIHGKGTGKLRQGVREFLRSSPAVKSHETGKDDEGGEGVTVVKLAVGE